MLTAITIILGHEFRLPGRHRRHHRPERGWQDDSVPHGRTEQPEAGTIRVGEYGRTRLVDQSRARSTDVDLGVSGADVVKLGNPRSLARHVGRFNFAGQYRRRRSASSRASAPPVHLRQDSQVRANVLYWTSRRTPRRDTMRALEEPWRTSPAAPSSSATTAGSSTARPPHPRLRGRQPRRRVEGNYSDTKGQARPPRRTPPPSRTASVTGSEGLNGRPREIKADYQNEIGHGPGRCSPRATNRWWAEGNEYFTG